MYSKNKNTSYDIVWISWHFNVELKLMMAALLATLYSIAKL